MTNYKFLTNLFGWNLWVLQNEDQDRPIATKNWDRKKMAKLGDVKIPKIFYISDFKRIVFVFIL